MSATAIAERLEGGETAMRGLFHTLKVLRSTGLRLGAVASLLVASEQPVAKERLAALADAGYTALKAASDFVDAFDAKNAPPPSPRGRARRARGRACDAPAPAYVPVYRSRRRKQLMLIVARLAVYGGAAAAAITLYPREEKPVISMNLPGDLDKFLSLEDEAAITRAFSAAYDNAKARKAAGAAAAGGAAAG